MASSGTAGDASNNVRPTEAQLRWAQFHHKRRAQGVKLSIVRLYQTPEKTGDVVGAYPEDGNSTTSISEGEIRQRRPKISEGRRAYLRVSRRKYRQRALEIENDGFRRLQGDDTFSDVEDDELNDIFMTKRRQQRRRKRGDMERLKRFEDACHAMMMNLAQPDEQVISIPTKRWTRTADHIAASAMLAEEYLDPKWGIRRRTLATSRDGIENQFNLQHKAMTPLDRGASWLMHLPDTIPSSRDNPSSYFRNKKQSAMTAGSVVSEGVSEGGQSVSTLAMKAPGQEKFNQLVALAQRQLIGQEYDHLKDSPRFGHPLSLQDELTNPHMYGSTIQSKPTKSYMPRVRLRDFVLDSEKGEEACSEGELDPEELAALNQIPKDKYLQALRLSKHDKNSLTKAATIGKQEIGPLATSRIPTTRTVYGNSGTTSKSRLQPEELAVMESIVSGRLRDLEIEPYATRTHYLDMADEIVQWVEAAEEDVQNYRLRQLFESIKQSPKALREDDTGLAKSMALQQIINDRIKDFEGHENGEEWTRYSRAKVIVAAFDSNIVRFVGLHSRTPHGSSSASFRKTQYKNLYHIEGKIEPEELIVMCQGISLHLEQELQGKEKEKMKSSFRRTVGMTGIFDSTRSSDTAKMMREMYDRFEKQADGPLSVDRGLQLDELFVLRNMIRSLIQAIETGGNVSEIKRLTRAKLIAQVFEADKHESKTGRIKEMVQSLESENKLLRYGKDQTSSVNSSNEKRLSGPINKGNAHPEREPSHSEPTRPQNSDEPGQEIPALDKTLQGLWHRGKNSLNGISSVLSHESASGPFIKPIRDTALSVSEKVNLLLQNSKSEPNQPPNSRQESSIRNESLTVSDRIDLYLDHLKAAPNSGTAMGTNQTTMQSENVSGQFEKLLRNFQNAEESGSTRGPEARSSFRQPNDMAHRLRNGTMNQWEQEARFSLSKQSSTPRRRNDGDSDEAEIQPQPPVRTKVEQEIFDAIEATVPRQETAKEYVPDELDADFLAAYRKKRDSTNPVDDTSSASSYKVLPSGFREVVKHYSPSRDIRGFTPSRPKHQESSHLEESREIPKLSEENVREFAKKSSIDTFNLGVIDSDEISSDVGRHIDPSLLSSLMLSPDLLTKRHQQAVRAIERSQWDDVNYLINANPWLAEMCELTTKQYLLHKIAFFGAGRASAPVELCELLMDKFPAAVHKFDEDGNVPLHLAAAAGHMKMISMLGEKFESGASIRNEDGMLPLHFALASYGRLGFAAVPGGNSRSGDNVEPSQVVQKVLSFFPQAVAISDNDGNLPLHVAVHCLEGQVAIDAISLLLDESEKQLKDPYGARFYNKVKIEGSLGDGMPQTFARNDEEDLETYLHCSMVRNNDGECPLVLAIHSRKGWQIIDTLVAGPGGQEAALYQDSNNCNALHLLVGEYQDPAAALSILKAVPETTTARNSAGMLPIEVACMQLMPDEVILAIALADLHIDLSGDNTAAIGKNFGGSWWFLTCECDDHYVDIVRNLVSMCSFEQIRMLCVIEGGSSKNMGTVISRATPKCREVLAQAIRFLGRFEFAGKTPLYSDVDKRIKAFDAFDFGGGSHSSDEGRRVLLKSYSLRDVFLAETEILRAYELDESKVEEVLAFSLRDGGDGLSEQSWVSIEYPEATLKDVADSMIRKGGYWNQPDLRSKYSTKVCLVLRLIAKSLRHLHTNGVVHGDLSLRSCGLFEHEWKLLGRMEVQPMGQAFDTARFQYSFPPESLQSSDLDINIYDTDAPPVSFKQSIISDSSIDIWAFGKLAYEAILGKPLVAYDANLPVNDVVALLEVMEWNEDCLKDVFHELLEAGGIAESGAELFTSCLFPRPEDRPKSMEEILSHPFWQQNMKERKKAGGSRRRRNTDTEAKSLFSELSD